MRILFIWGCVQTAAAANCSSIKKRKEKKRKRLCSLITSVRVGTAQVEMVTVWMAAVTTTTKKVFQMTLKVEVMLIHFSDVRDWHPRKSLPKSAKPAIPLRRKPQNTHTQKGMLKANDANLPWSHDQQYFYCQSVQKPLFYMLHHHYIHSPDFVANPTAHSVKVMHFMCATCQYIVREYHNGNTFLLCLLHKVNGCVHR